MSDSGSEREILVLGLGERIDRGAVVCSYLAEAGYWARTARFEELEDKKPLGIVLDISTRSKDGWGILTELKKNPHTRDIPVLPVFLSEKGKVGGAFPVAGFFLSPVDPEHLADKLTVMGLIEEAEEYDLQTMLVSRRGDEAVGRAIEDLGFDLVNAYSAKEAVAIASTDRPYMIFTSFMLPDSSAFELQERLKLYPQTRNIPIFVLLKDLTKEGERLAMSRSVEHLVRKKELTRQEFVSCLRKR